MAILDCFLFISFLILILPNPLVFSHSFQSNQCGDKCGSFQIPFPFYINSSCGSVSDDDPFRLICHNSTSLSLTISSKTYPILQFFPDGVLVDFPNTTSATCRPYNDLNAFGFDGNDYFGISADNIIGLYDCEDSSLCKTECEKTVMPPGCDGSSGSYPACCYPLSDRTSWHVGDGFSVFSQFGCRGFSCWVVPPGTNIGKRGVKLEWAVPGNSSAAVCAANAYTVNATSVPSGVRCQCSDGFIGDAFADGVGCSKTCLRDGKEAYGDDCFLNGHGRIKVEILAGVVTLALCIASLTAIFCLLKRPTKSNTFDRSAVSCQKACKTRLFSYRELDEATKGFEEGQRLVDGNNGTLYAGVLGDGSHVAVHKMHCENEREFIQFIYQSEIFSAFPHRNLARLLGCCVDSAIRNPALIVYEYPANGTLQEHLRGQQFELEWYKRLNIASETASVLTFLQHEVSPPIFHHDLRSGFIFLDEDFSVKIAGFGANHGEGSHSGDVYGLGVVLLEIVTGARIAPTMALQKIRSGKVEEIVDPVLYYHEQPPFRREQIEAVADLATRCLLFGGRECVGRLGMVDVARELVVHVTKESAEYGSSRRGGPVLEETFSNSSLLQMISMSPDSIHVP
ncbi:unnamed protein product [Camellia sinensis]